LLTNILYTQTKFLTTLLLTAHDRPKRLFDINANYKTRTFAKIIFCFTTQGL